jgi:N-acetylmuramic acid 6-phosphate etherase
MRSIANIAQRSFLRDSLRGGSSFSLPLANGRLGVFGDLGFAITRMVGTVDRMSRKHAARSGDFSIESIWLGIETGGTRSVALLAGRGGECLQRIELGPANLRLTSDSQLVDLFRRIQRQLVASPDSIGLGVAGARTEGDLKRIRAAVGKVWPDIPCCAANDLESAFLADIEGEGSAVRVLVLSGTGSCCWGRNKAGKTARSGGWGHLLGDRGSGYAIGHSALRGVLESWDHSGRWPLLGARFLQSLELNEPDDLIEWAQNAEKEGVGRLAVEVCEMAEEKEPLAVRIVEEMAESLSKDAIACAGKLAAAGSDVRFILAGGLLLKQPFFARLVTDRIERQWRKGKVVFLCRESAWGAVALARKGLEEERKAGRQLSSDSSSAPHRASAVTNRKGGPENAWERFLSQFELSVSPTEQRNPRSLELHRMPLGEAIALMLKEEESVSGALLGQASRIERAIRWISAAFRSKGRLFYAGAGTSGRLGVLDASECPPTFGADPCQVQGIIAGGQRALWQAVEGAEDHFEAGARALEFRGVDRKDVVVGIAASGRTPFVWGILGKGKELGAKTILVTFNPALRIPKEMRPDLIIAPGVGPEVLTGSTRLKAGTATKLILNLFTTLAMVRLGKVYSNLMIDLDPSNSKLRERAARIVRDITGVGAAEAVEALEKSGWVARKAVNRLQKA